MSSTLSSTAMVLAAGLGQRMRPLTLETPKPLLRVGGRTMLDHALDKLLAFGIRRAVVNAHYLAEQIAAHVVQRTDMELILAHEDELLDTGGGVKNALRYFNDKPFFVVNADLPWMDAAVPSLAKLATTWNAASMDSLLLLMPRDKALGFGGRGDYALRPDNRAERLSGRPLTHVMLSAYIMKPEKIAAHPAKVFSNRVLWDEAEAAGRLFGVEHEGTCYHVGTPDDWHDANARLADGRGWDVP